MILFSTLLVGNYNSVSFNACPNCGTPPYEIEILLQSREPKENMKLILNYACMTTNLFNMKKRFWMKAT
jgi:hypothetical protein